MQNDIDILFKAGFFSNLDYFFATTLLGIAHENDQIVKLSAALASKHSRGGSVCLDINQIANQPILLTDYSDNSLDHANNIEALELRLPAIEPWLKALKKSKFVGKDCDFPLVLDSDNKLYLAKFFDFQKRIVKNILQRIQYQTSDIDIQSLNIDIDRHFSDIKDSLPEEKKGLLTQKNAVQKALINNFIIISGGPGTGKTYITDKISSIFENLSKKSDSVKIINTAPTGKAASKLNAGLTIHRLLGIKNNTRINQNHGKTRISADLVIIDEASMIDISLMTKLLEAIPISSKVIMIGDKNQLGSIETGSVFSDICQSEKLNKLIFNLDYNFRSGLEKGINKLAKAVNAGDKKAIESLLKGKDSKSYDDISFIKINDLSEINSKIQDHIIKGYLPYLKENDLKLAYKKLGNFKILCSHRKGILGSTNINMITERILQSCAIHDINHSFLKSSLMITKNDYNKHLFNGDIGMIIEHGGQNKAVFMDEELELQYYNLSELKAYESAFAITVHKSQGSEFDHVLFILPSASSNLLTRELLYTAITRARKTITIAGNIDIIKQAAEKHSKRESGITRLLDKIIDEQ